MHAMYTRPFSLFGAGSGDETMALLVHNRPSRLVSCPDPTLCERKGFWVWVGAEDGARLDYRGAAPPVTRVTCTLSVGRRADTLPYLHIASIAVDLIIAMTSTVWGTPWDRPSSPLL